MLLNKTGKNNMKTNTNNNLTKDNREIYCTGDSNHGFKIGDVINENVLILINNELKKEYKSLIKTYSKWNDNKSYTDNVINTHKRLNLI